MSTEEIVSATVPSAGKHIDPQPACRSRPPHFVQFYEDDELLAAAVSRFIAEGAAAGEGIIVIATEGHWLAIERELAKSGVVSEPLRAGGQLRVLSAVRVLSDLVVEGELSRGRFDAIIGELVTNSLASNPAGVRAYGEMVDVLWTEGKRSLAIQLEELWNELQARCSFTLLCAYAAAGFYREPASARHVGSVHTHVHIRQDAVAGFVLIAPYPSSLAEEEIARRVDVEMALREALRELRIGQEEAQRSRDRLEAITDALPVAVALVGADQRFEFVNAEYARRAGRAKAEIAGESLERVLGAAECARVAPHVARALAGERVCFHLERRDSAGRDRVVEATYLPQQGRDGRGIGFVALLVDVTERARVEQIRRAAAERTTRLLQITAAIAEAVSAEQVFDAVVGEVATVVGASSAALWVMDDARCSATLARSLGYRGQSQAHFGSLTLSTAAPSPARDVLLHGEAIWISSQPELLNRYPELAASVTPGREYRIASLPLVTRGSVLGALALTLEEAREWTDEERSFLLLVARYAGQALERLRLLAAERASRAEADAAAARAHILSAASRTFVETDLDVPSRLAGVVRELGRSMNSCVGIATVSASGFLDASSSVFHPSPEATAELLALGREAPLKLGEGITGKVAQTGESVLIPSLDPAELAARAAPTYRAFLERFPTYAMMCVPLRSRGRIIGTVTATRVRSGEQYTSADLSLLEDLADRAASAIENSQLYQENAYARARAEQLYRFAQTVVAAENQEQVFDAALAAVEVTLKTDRAAILIFDQGGVMRFRAWRGLSDDYRRAVDGHSPWSANTVSPQPVLVNDVEADQSVEQYLPVFRKEDIGALAFFPIVSRGQLLGKLMVYHRGAHRYSEQEVDVARSVGAHLGSVVSRFAATERLQETVRYNELFAGVLAHDLRNPLAAVVTAAQLLQLRFGQTDERSAKPLAKILSSGQRMGRMIEQLLDVTRARAGGGIEVRKHKMDLAEVCDHAAGELELAHPSWSIQCVFHGDSSGTWDRDRLAQVLSNLIANAGQHGRGAAILVTLDGRENDAILLHVHNEGAIPSDLLPTLFDPFRGSSSPRTQSRGLGLGLFIVHEIVRAHEGTISVDSSEAGGTTFTVTLPRH